MSKSVSNESPPQWLRRALSRSVFFPLVLASAVGLILVGQLRQVITLNKNIDITDLVVGKTYQSLTILFDLEESVEDYLVTGSPVYVSHYESLKGTVSQILSQLRDQEGVNSAQMRRAQYMIELFAKWDGINELLLHKRSKHYHVAGERILSELRSLHNEFILEEDSLRVDRIHRTRWVTNTSILLCLLLVVLLGGVLSYFNRRQLLNVSETYRTNEEKWRTMTEAVPGLVWSARSDGRIDFMNRRWRDTLDALPAEGWQGLIHPDDRKERRQAWLTALTTGQTFEGEFRLRHKDGSYRWYLTRAVPVRDEHGTITKWLGTCLDTSDRKRSEDLQKALDEVTLLLSDTLNYRSALPMVSRLLVPHFADWILLRLTVGYNLQCVVVNHSDPAMTEACREAERRYPPDLNAPLGFTRSQTNFRAELWPSVDDQVLSIVANSTEHKDFLKTLNLQSLLCAPLIVQGQTAGTLLFGSTHYRFNVRDLAFVEELSSRLSRAIDNAKLYEDLQEQTRALERSNQELNQFASIASHDLQAPLRTISSYAQLLTRKYGEDLPSGAREYLGAIVEGTTKMHHLINDLLTYARSASSDRAPAVISSQKLFDDVMLNLNSTVEETKATVTHDPLPEVLGDRTQLMQVFQNLISNALKFCKDRSPVVHVGVNHHSGHWLFSVRDNGIGIEERAQKNIFKIFHRIHGEFPGSGIGLAICKKIIERHNGRIWVESREGEGSTFFFTLPQTQPARDWIADAQVLS